jgi:hypothetical protein
METLARCDHNVNCCGAAARYVSHAANKTLLFTSCDSRAIMINY